MAHGGGEGEFAAEMPSGLWFNYRRLVGGTRVLLSEGSWRLFLRRSDVDANVAALCETVPDWDGVSSGPHRYGGTEFLFDGREVGHIHDWGLLDVPLVRPLGEAVVDAGEAAHHHILPGSGWVTTIVETDADRERALSLLRLSYWWHVAKYATGDRAVDRETAVERVRELALDERVAEAFATALEART